MEAQPVDESVLPQAQPAKEKAEPQLAEIDDKTYQKLGAMSTEEMETWLKEAGASAIIQLNRFYARKGAEDLQAQRGQIEEKVRKEGLQDEIETFKVDAKDLFEDKDVAAMMAGLERALLQSKGYRNYLELSPKQLREHLAQVATKTRKLLGKTSAETPSAEQEPAPMGNDPFGLSDVRGSGSADATDLTVMDGIQLENHIRALGATKREQLFTN